MTDSQETVVTSARLNWPKAQEFLSHEQLPVRHARSTQARTNCMHARGGAGQLKFILRTTLFEFVQKDSIFGQNFTSTTRCVHLSAANILFRSRNKHEFSRSLQIHATLGKPEQPIFASSRLNISHQWLYDATCWFYWFKWRHRRGQRKRL